MSEQRWTEAMRDLVANAIVDRVWATEGECDRIAELALNALADAGLLVMPSTTDSSRTWTLAAREKAPGVIEVRATFGPDLDIRQEVPVGGEMVTNAKLPRTWSLPAGPGPEVKAVRCKCHGWLFMRTGRVDITGRSLWQQDVATAPVGNFVHLLDIHLPGLTDATAEVQP